MFVYLLKSINQNRYYIGSTQDVEKRLQEHNNGYVQSTKPYKPWGLLGIEKYKTKNEARWQEYKLKKNTSLRKKFINKLDNTNLPR